MEVDIKVVEKDKRITNLIGKWLSNRADKNKAQASQLESAIALIKEIPELSNKSWSTIKEEYPVVFEPLYKGFIQDHFSKPENARMIGKAINIEGLDKPVEISIDLCIKNKKEITAEAGEEVALYLRNNVAPYGKIRNLDTNITGKKGLWSELQADFKLVEKEEKIAIAKKQAEDKGEEYIEEVEDTIALSRCFQSAKNIWKENNTFLNAVTKKGATPSKLPVDKSVGKKAQDIVFNACKNLLLIDEDKTMQDIYKIKDKNDSEIQKILNEL